MVKPIHKSGMNIKATVDLKAWLDDANEALKKGMSDYEEWRNTGVLGVWMLPNIRSS